MHDQIREKLEIRIDEDLREFCMVRIYHENAKRKGPSRYISRSCAKSIRSPGPDIAKGIAGTAKVSNYENSRIPSILRSVHQLLVSKSRLIFVSALIRTKGSTSRAFRYKALEPIIKFMKIALTFLTLSVVLLLGSLMWGMKTYTDLAHALSDVDDLKQELDRYRSGAQTYPVAIQGGVVAQAQLPNQGFPAQPVAQVPVPVPVPVPALQPAPPALDESEIEARLEEMIASRMGEHTAEPEVSRDSELDGMEAKLAEMEKESSAIDRERTSLLSEPEITEKVTRPLLTDVQNTIATAPVLANITEANTQYSFVVMDAGENKNISVGDTYSIRREHMIIGEAVIDTVEPAAAVANVKASSVPAGLVIQKGDQVVEFVESSGS
jgi:hypothetical protein